VGEQAGFQFALVEGLLEGEEVEEVGVLEQAGGETGVNVRQGGGEVGDGDPLAFVGAVIDLNSQGFTAPALLQGLPGIPETSGKSGKSGSGCVS
jgi:hypothetical protein